MSKINFLKPDKSNLNVFLYLGSFLFFVSILDVLLNSFFSLNITGFLPNFLGFFLPLVLGFIGLYFIRIESSGIKELDLLNKHINTNNFNAILSQIQFEKSPLVDYYESRGAEPVKCNKEQLLSEGYFVLEAPLYSRRITPTLRHDPRRFARAVMFIYRKLKKIN